MCELIPGKSFRILVSVTEEMLASSVGSGTLPVLATPAVAALMEQAAWKLVQPSLPDGITTVGTFLQVEHLRPSGVGAQVEVTAVLTEVSQRQYAFSITAADAQGVLAKAGHRRATVKSQRFLEKAGIPAGT